MMNKKTVIAGTLVAALLSFVPSFSALAVTGSAVGPGPAVNTLTGSGQFGTAPNDGNGGIRGTSGTSGSDAINGTIGTSGNGLNSDNTVPRNNSALFNGAVVNPNGTGGSIDNSNNLSNSGAHSGDDRYRNNLQPGGGRQENPSQTRQF